MTSFPRALGRPLGVYTRRSAHFVNGGHLRSFSHASRPALLSTAEQQQSESTSGPRGKKTESTTSKIIGAAVFLGLAGFTAQLGFWQVQRRDWKQGLIDQRKEMLGKEPVDLLQLLRSEDLADSKYQRVTVTGVLDQSREMFVGPRGAPENGLKKDKGAVGYIVVTPMKLADGSEVLINRGWVPTPEKRTVENDNSNGLTTIVGVLTNGEARPPFLGDYELGDGEDKKTWIYLDAARMTQHMSLSQPKVAAGSDVDPTAVEAEADSSPATPTTTPDTGPARVFNLSSDEKETDGEDADMRNVLRGGALVVEALDPKPKSVYPIRKQASQYCTFYTMPTNHTIYAGTWFALSGAAVLLTFYRFRKTPPRGTIKQRLR